MQIPEWVWPVATVLIAALALYYGRRDGRDKGRDERIREVATLNTKMDLVVGRTDSIDKKLETGLTNIETRLTAICKKQEEQAVWLARVEESAKSAHHRIDEIRKSKEE